MAKPVPGCVVFDVDDTLYLERDYVRSGFEAIAPWAERTTGLSHFAARAWAEFEAGRRGDIFDHLVPEGGETSRAVVVAELVRRYRQHVPTIALLDDARTCLDLLQGRTALAVITDGPAESQRAKVSALGLARWMSPIVVTSELGDGMGKPHPRAFQMVEEAAGQPGAACVYVADNPKKDFLGPAALGWQTVRVRREKGLHRSTASGREVGVEVTDLSGLAGLLGFQS